jgi:1-acyl-sn-glycerol-3-phosphate acyltransferase
MKLPPRWLRRFVLWPLPLLLVWLYVAAVPLLLIAALIWSYKLPGKLRALRSLGLFSVYVFVEAALILSAFALWIASGFGWKLRSDRFQDAHYRLLRWALDVLVGAGKRLFSLSIEAERSGGLDVTSPDEVEAPLIVMSRHAGPADSILLLQRLMTNGRRHPRIVLKADLQIDPAFDIMLNRLPNRFVRSGSGPSTVEAVGALAADMGPGDAFVIFPEGGNFTEGRRQRAIDRFEERGEAELAERARSLRHTLPPRPGGTLAALRACPGAVPAFVGHTGLDHIEGVRDLWTAIPEDKTVRAVWRAVPPENVPDDDAERTELLWRAWEAIDAWVGADPGEPAAPPD